MCKFIFLLLFLSCSSYGSFKRFTQFLENNCFECHDEDISKGDLRLDNLSPENSDFDEILKRAFRSVESHLMPPKKSLNPTEKDYFLKLIASYFSKKEAKQKKQIGRSTYRRLTKEEYQNSLRSIFDLPEIYVDPLLPEEDFNKHFTKNHTGLNVSSVHLKSYLDAAERALRGCYKPTPKPKFITKKLNLVVPK